MSICLISRFKNEGHILYEFIHHYLLEGVDYFILIDDNSDDNYLINNKEWINPLIKNRKILIEKAKLPSKEQAKEYNLFLPKLRKFRWVICCDLDEFSFGVHKNYNLKKVLNKKLFNYDYILIPWKSFRHESYKQPKSVIKDNIITHNKKIDPLVSSKGYKYIVKSNVIIKMHIHTCKINQKGRILRFLDCHNNLIQINHYKTQSEEFLRGVKEMRGGSVHNCKYKKYTNHLSPIYNKKCLLLANKRKNLIKKCYNKKQIRPKINKNSSFFLEINKNNNNDNNDKESK